MKAKPKILVADDVRDIRDMLRAILEEKYDLIFARNGEEAWELFNAEKPDLVLTDAVMPRINGLDLCRRIKNSTNSETPVIIMTGATGDRELADGVWKMAAGSDGFISKPFSLDEILEKIEQCLGNQGRSKESNAS